MNANPALHTNCTALKNIVPTVVNETLGKQKEAPPGGGVFPCRLSAHQWRSYWGGMLSCHGPSCQV